MGLDVLMLRHCIKGFVLIKLEPEALKGDSAHQDEPQKGRVGENSTPPV